MRREGDVGVTNREHARCSDGQYGARRSGLRREHRALQEREHAVSQRQHHGDRCGGGGVGDIVDEDAVLEGAREVLLGREHDAVARTRVGNEARREDTEGAALGAEETLPIADELTVACDGERVLQLQQRGRRRVGRRVVDERRVGEYEHPAARLDQHRRVVAEHRIDDTQSATVQQHRRLVGLEEARLDRDVRGMEARRHG